MGAVGSPWKATLAAREALLLEPGEDQDEHLICGCRPQISLCGTYDPNAHGVVYGDPTDRDCPDCRKVWKAHGCGSCGCNHRVSCDKCWARYQLHQAPTH